MYRTHPTKCQGITATSFCMLQKKRTFFFSNFPRETFYHVVAFYYKWFHPHLKWVLFWLHLITLHISKPGLRKQTNKQTNKHNLFYSADNPQPNLLLIHPFAKYPGCSTLSVHQALCYVLAVQQHLQQTEGLLWEANFHQERKTKSREQTWSNLIK